MSAMADWECHLVLKDRALIQRDCSAGGWHVASANGTFCWVEVSAKEFGMEALSSPAQPVEITVQ